MRTYYGLGFIAVFVAVAVACDNAHPLRGPSQATDAPGDFTGDGTVSRDAIDDAGSGPTSVERPIARLSVPALVNAGDEIALDGEGSTAASGAALAYAWRITPVESGGRFSLRDETHATAVARFLTRGRYRVTLIVNADGVDSAPAEAAIEADDTAVRPIARAGVDQDVVVGTVVTLDGAGSHDPNGDPLSYDWTILEGGALPGFDEHAKSPKFSAALPHATYRFSLVVKDGMHASQSDEVLVHVKNSPPELSGIVDHPVHLKTVPLEVTATDKDGDALTYAWDFVSKPQGSTATILDPTARQTSFVVDVLGTYDVRVKVSDGRAESVAVMKVAPYNAAPGINDGMATPAEMPHSCAGNRCTATSTLSVNVVDADDRDLLVAFNLKEAPNAQVVATFCTAPTKPPTSSRAGWTNIVCDVTLATEGRAATDPAPGIAGNYVFEAKVTDSFGESRSLEIAALVKNDAPTVTVSGATTVNYQARRDAQNAALWELTATASFVATATDPENGLKSTRWSVVKAPTGVTVTLGARVGATQPVTISVASTDVATLKRFVSTDYELEFQATDINDATATRRISFAIVDRPLVWNGVEGDTTVPHKTTVNGNVATITATYDLTANVTDLDGRIAEYQWEYLGQRIATTSTASAHLDFSWVVNSGSQPPVSEILARDVSVKLVDFKDGVTFGSVRLETNNTPPTISQSIHVAWADARKCWGPRFDGCKFALYVDDQNDWDDDGDLLERSWQIESPPAGRVFTPIGRGDVPTRLVFDEIGPFSFDKPPFSGRLTLKLTVRDFLGGTATKTVDATFPNVTPRPPQSTIASDNEFGACSLTECVAVFSGDVALITPTVDGDGERVIVSTPTVGATVEKRSGSFTGCEQDVLCLGSVCGPHPTRWRSSRPVAFTNKWVVKYLRFVPTELVAVAEDWNLARSAEVRIPIAIVTGRPLSGCTPKIELLTK